jgi:transglutaminase-like putative cysteine protease
MNGYYTTPTSIDYEPVHGNGVLYWRSTDQPEPGKTVKFGEQFYVTVYAISAQVNPGDVQPYDTSSELYQLYTKSEKNLEAAEALVIQAAQEAVGSETNPYLQAKLIYEWIAPHLSYQTNNNLQGALLTLQLGGGECGDYSAVFVAMARAVGIPARPVVGYMAASGASHHVWAEFYLQGLGWLPVDATFGDQGEAMNEWYFGNLDNGRIILSKNYNLTLVPSSEKAELFQTYYWWYWGSGGSLQAEETWTVVGP